MTPEPKGDDDILFVPLSSRGETSLDPSCDCHAFLMKSSSSPSLAVVGIIVGVVVVVSEEEASSFFSSLGDIYPSSETGPTSFGSFNLPVPGGAYNGRFPEALLSSSNGCQLPNGFSSVLIPTASISFFLVCSFSDKPRQSLSYSPAWYFFMTALKPSSPPPCAIRSLCICR